MTITNYKPIDRGSLVGAFDLTLSSGICINGMKLFSRRDGGHFVSFPEREYEKDGEKKYAKIVWIEDRETRDKFSNAAVEALKMAGHI